MSDKYNSYLAQGADIDLQNQEGATALIIASVSGNKEIVKVLLDKEAKVNFQENKGGAALKHAKTRKIRELLRI